MMPSPDPGRLHCSEQPCGGRRGAGVAAPRAWGSAARYHPGAFSGRTARSWSARSGGEFEARQAERDPPEPWNERLADKWYEFKSLSRSLGRQSKRKLKEATTEAVHAIKAAVDPEARSEERQDEHGQRDSRGGLVEWRTQDDIDWDHVEMETRCRPSASEHRPSVLYYALGEGEDTEEGTEQQSHSVMYHALGEGEDTEEALQEGSEGVFEDIPLEDPDDERARARQKCFDALSMLGRKCASPFRRKAQEFADFEAFEGSRKAKEEERAQWWRRLRSQCRQRGSTSQHRKQHGARRKSR